LELNQLHYGNSAAKSQGGESRDHVQSRESHPPVCRPPSFARLDLPPGRCGMSHPGAEVLSELLGALHRRQLDVLHHVLECRVCRVGRRPVLAARRVEEAEGGLEAGYDAMWERLEESALAAAGERAREEGEVAERRVELLTLPQAERLEAIANDARFHSWAL